MAREVVASPSLGLELLSEPRSLCSPLPISSLFALLEKIPRPISMPEDQNIHYKVREESKVQQAISDLYL